MKKMYANRAVFLYVIFFTLASLLSCQDNTDSIVGGESLFGRNGGGGSAIFKMTININTSVFNPSQVAVDLFDANRTYYYGVKNVVNGKIEFTDRFPGGTGFRIKVTDLSDPNNHDVSNASFSIAPF